MLTAVVFVGGLVGCSGAEPQAAPTVTHTVTATVPGPTVTITATPTGEVGSEALELEGDVAEGFPGEPLDPMPLLAAARSEVPGLYQCDTSMTITIFGVGTASCIVPDELLAVGVSSNLVMVQVFADQAQQDSELATFDVPYASGPGWAVSAPKQETVDAFADAVRAAAGAQGSAS